MNEYLYFRDASQLRIYFAEGLVHASIVVNGVKAITVAKSVEECMRRLHKALPCMECESFTTK